MFAIKATLATCVLLLSSAVLCEDSSAVTSVTTERVTDCNELQAALNRNYVSRIIVHGNLKCTRENWRVPVVVQRNLEITGAAAESNSTAPDGGSSIDWTDTSHVVIVERAAVSVHDLVMYQNELGVGGLTVAFIHTRQGAAAVFAGMVVVVQTCSQQVRSYAGLINQIPRPVFLAGEQRTETLGSSVLLVQDVAIWWPNLNSVWQLCNTVIVCVDSYSGTIPVAEYFTTGLVTNSCAVHSFGSSATDQNKAPVLSVRPGIRNAQNTATDADQSSDETDATSTIIIVAIVVAIVIIITAFLSYKILCGRSSSPNRSSESQRDAESISYETGSFRDATSTRFIENRNDMDLNLFERRTNVPLQDVVIGTLLGRGGFGKVYKGTWKGTAVAIKVIVHGERLLQNDLQLPFEAYLSRHISHPNVVQTFLIHTRQKGSPNGVTVDTLDFYHPESPASTKKSGSVQSVDVFSNMAPQTSASHEGGELFQTWLVLEFCDRGSLSKAVRKGDLTHRLTGEPMLDHILLSALDVANAMNYLHSLGITHGDLKADNVLLKSASTDRRGFFCKVSDFGLSRYVGDEDYLQTFTYGTITHMPPELLQNGFFSTAVDVYSFGILLWELLAITPPYPDKNPGHILLTVVNEGRRPQIADSYPRPYADLIKDCWKQIPEDRPKFSEIVRRLKGMLADLEINNAMMRNGDEAAETNRNEMSGSGRSDGSDSKCIRVPQRCSHSVSIPPDTIFATEPAAFHEQLSSPSPVGSSVKRTSGAFSTDSMASFSTTRSTTPRSELSCFEE